MLLFGVAAVFAAEDIVNVTGEYTYYGDDNTTPKEARRLALEGARLDALAKAFGTTVTQSLVSDETVKDGKESNFFKSYSETEVKGEWLADNGEPEYKVSYDNDGNIVMYCKVKGRARALSNEAPDFEVAVLRNGTELRHADTRFRSGDDMRLYFKAPVDGYIAVYLCGDDRMAYTLLPYSTSSVGCVKVKRGQEYVFFDTRLSPAELRSEVDEMQLMTDEVVERDRFYVLFSPKPFVKANDNFTAENLPRSMPFNDFYKWLTKTRRNDPSLALKYIDVTIDGNPE